MIPHEDEIRELAIEADRLSAVLELLDSTNRPATWTSENRADWAASRAVIYTRWLTAQNKLRQLQDYVAKPSPLVAP